MKRKESQHNPIFSLGFITKNFFGALFGLGLTIVWSVEFEKVKVGDFRGESAAFGDINKDGHLDVVAGGAWWENQGDPLSPGNWIKHTRHNSYSLGIDANGHGYNSNDDFIHTLDVNHDGLPDILGGSSQGHFFLNPGLNNIGGSWTGLSGAPGGHDIHSGPMWDVDNDGVTEEYLIVRGDGAAVRWMKYENNSWNNFQLDPTGSNYGGGVGDVDGDGDVDIIRPGAWFERNGSGQTELDPKNPANWTRHEIAVGALISDTVHVSGRYGAHPTWIGKNNAGFTGHVAQIYAYDVDNDGRNDLITTSAHRKGVFWYKQEANGSFTEVLVDSMVSQGHSTAFADLDADGVPDLIVGKRYKAHNGSDPLTDDPVTLNWYKLTPGAANPFTKKIIAEDVSSGTDMDVADIEGDGDLDIVVTAKNAEGPWVLVNKTFHTGDISEREILFDGTQKDLDDNWYAKGGNWNFENGNIHVRNPTQAWGHLFTNKEYTNFFLRLKYRNLVGNTGVYIRAQDGGDYGAIGIQIDMGPNGQFTQDGSVMTVTEKRWKWLPRHPKVNQITNGEWHELAINVVGQTYQIYVDGKLIEEQKDVSYTLMPPKGKIALQVHQGENNDVEFKDIVVFTPGIGDTTRVPVHPKFQNSLHETKVFFDKTGFQQFLTNQNVLEITNIKGIRMNSHGSISPGLYRVLNSEGRVYKVYVTVK